MVNFLIDLLEPVLNLLVTVINNGILIIWDLTMRLLTYFGYRPIIRCEPGSGITVWEDDAEPFSMITLKHYEDENERAICLTATNQYSQVAFKALIIEKKRFGAITRCYIYKKIPGTDRIKMMKIPLSITVQHVVDVFEMSFDD